MIGIALRNKQWVSVWSQHDRLTIANKWGCGYVYFIGCEQYGDAIKIGKTRQKPDSRRGGMQVGCPYQLIIYAAFYTDQYEKIEKMMHSIYEPKKVRGEWYDIGRVPYDMMRHFGCVNCDAFGKTTRNEVCKTLNIIESLPESSYKEKRKRFLDSIEYKYR